MAAPTITQIDERIASAEREYKKLLAELRADRRAAVARERQADGEFQGRVRDFIGELVISLHPGGWRAIDPYALEQVLAQALAGLEPADELPLADAQALWKQWRKRGKGAPPASEGPVPPGVAPGEVTARPCGEPAGEGCGTVA